MRINRLILVLILSTVMIDISNPHSNNLNCPTCLLPFGEEAGYKEHYKSDFHRYNLKRKMLKLAPATLDQFKGKKLLTNVQQSSEFKCNQCGKKFSSSQTLNQHVRSKGHDPNMMKESSQSPKKKPKAYQKNENQCLFCWSEAKQFNQNLNHMEKQHGFFIPQKSYCKDEKNLICYLQEKIEVGFMCITCENKGAKDFASGEAVRKHMVDKGHCFMKTSEGYEEYEKFYDFSSQFTAIIEEQKNKNVLGIQYEKVQVIIDDKAQEVEDDGNSDWEDVESDEDDEAEDEWEDENEDDEEQDWDDEEQIKEEEEKVKTKTYYVMKPTVTNNEQLLLPNGKILGHRKYRYLYRQTYRAPFWLQKQLKAIGSEAVSNALITKQNLIELIKKEKLTRNSKTRADKKHLKVGMQNNKLMKYFRTQNSL